MLLLLMFLNYNLFMLKDLPLPNLDLGQNVRIFPEWTRTREGYRIGLYHSKDVTIAAKSKSTQPIIIIGGVHGDEPEGVEMATRCLNWASREADLCPWIIIPCINPEGYARQERTNSAGVDLNRNFPAKSWSSLASAPRYSPGPSPGSEPETAALVDLLTSQRPRLVIHCHSWNPCVVYTGDRARKDAAHLGQCSGYEMRTEIGYPTPGSLSQYGWHDNNIPIICVEAQEKSPLVEVWPRFANGFKTILQNKEMR